MRVFRKILLILMVIMLIGSAIFNILICNSSNGTLIFKHNDEKMISLASADRVNLTPSYFFSQNNKSYQLSKKTVNEKETTLKTYKIQFNKDYKVTTSIKESTTSDNNTSHYLYYYSDNEYYDENGNKKGNTVFEVNPGMTFLEEINILQDKLITDLETTNNKAKIEFSFSPFYLIGIKYVIKEDDKTTTYSYDLKGRLRKIIIKNKSSNTVTYSLNYKNEKVTIPTP